jgi:hypothetical protein
VVLILYIKNDSAPGNRNKPWAARRLDRSDEQPAVWVARVHGHGQLVCAFQTAEPIGSISLNF